MLEQEQGYMEFFGYVRELRAMLKPGTQQDLLNSYLEKLWDSRRKKQDVMRWNEAQLYRLLQRKCLIAMHGNVSESADGFTRLMHAYIAAHPLAEYGEDTRSRVYSWLFFPTYCEYLGRDEQNAQQQESYAYRELYRTIGAQQIERLCACFNRCFPAPEMSVLWSGVYEKSVAAELLKPVRETGQPLYELFLEQPKLLDYEWMWEHRKHSSPSV